MLASIPFGAAAMSYAAALVAFIAADMIWLGVMVPRFYKPLLGDVLAPGVNLPAAGAFYALYPVGLVLFAVAPALKAQSLSVALLQGALFGFFTYATYDLSNQATLRNWAIQLTIVDIAWGATLGALSSAIAFWAAGRLSGLS